MILNAIHFFPRAFGQSILHFAIVGAQNLNNFITQASL